MSRTIKLVFQGLGLALAAVLGVSVACWLALARPPHEKQGTEAAAPPAKPAGPGTEIPRGLPPGAGRRALLVGVTKYDHLPETRHLEGPGNDVRLVRDLLVQRFGFPAEAVVCLSEEQGQAGLRPTRANIEREFRRLAEAAQEGDQVVVLLAGHGSQQPESDPPDPDYPEPDGLDETFLPADVRRWQGDKEKVPGAITDNELGRWLKAITDRQAYVWAVFDSCHSGTMTRGTEVERELPPEELVPADPLRRAAQRAAERRRQAGGEHTRGGTDDAPRQPAVTEEPGDRLVALFACRPEERTPESPQPASSPAAKRYGLLTYTLCEQLAQAGGPITYRELLQRVQVQYARRPQGAQTPSVEGRGLDRQVLGTREWPRRSDLVLLRTRTGWRVNQGALHGLTEGSVLAVWPPAGQARTAQPLGHVRIHEVRESDADVRPCAWKEAALRADLPEQGTCQVVELDAGAGRFRLAVQAPAAAQQQAQAALKALGPLAAATAELVADPRNADWVLRQRDGRWEMINAAGTRGPFAVGQARQSDPLAGLGEMLEKIYRAQNLLTVATRVAQEHLRGGPAPAVDVEFRIHPGKKDPKSVPAPRGPDGPPVLREGQFVSFRVTNRGPTPVDVSLLIVGVDCGIVPFFPRSDEVGTNKVLPGQSLDVPPPYPPVIEPFGLEQLVVIAMPSQQPAADFTVLAQPALPQVRGARDEVTLNSPLGRLLESSLFRSGATRALPPREGPLGEHTIQVMNYRTVTGPAPAPAPAVPAPAPPAPAPAPAAPAPAGAGGAAALGALALAGIPAEPPAAADWPGLRLPDGGARVTDLDQAIRGLMLEAAREDWSGRRANPERSRGSGVEVYGRAAPAVVVVRSGNGHGAGFLVGPEGWVVTNHHVVEDAAVDPRTGAARVEVSLGRLADGAMQLEAETVPALVYKTSPRQDLALLKLQGKPKGIAALPVLRLADKAPGAGADCFALGHPGVGLLWSIRPGVISAVGRFPHDRADLLLPALGLPARDRARVAALAANAPSRKVLFTNCLIAGGDSGGPLVNERGEVVGVTFAVSARDGRPVPGFAQHVHLDELWTFLAERPAGPLVQAPDPWPPATRYSILDADKDGEPETVAFGVVTDEGLQVTGYLVDLDGRNPPEREMLMDPAKRAAWKFRFGHHLAPVARTFYDTDGDGQIDLVLTDTDGDGKADVRLRREKGVWRTEPAGDQALLDPTLLQGKKSQEHLALILRRLRK